MKLYVDDIREPPDSSWVIARSGHMGCVLVHLLRDHLVEVSLDNDMGEGQIEGCEVLNRIEEMHFNGLLPNLEAVHIHTANPAARRRMEATLRAMRKREIGRLR